ncbi:MAG: hypothetical protein OEY03_07610 [Rhizobacter sp.]|nr:hypothetical protein [Rhizobacter sp.]
MGTLNLFQASNVLTELDFKQKNAVMSWAYPGDTLQQMVKGIDDGDFDRELWNSPEKRGNFASFREGIIISAGGNDLIAAAEVLPVLKGKRVPPDKRLFLTADEVTALPGAPGPLRRISEAGWSTLSEYLFANFKILLERKNGKNPDGKFDPDHPSARSPLFLHTYATPAARPSGAGFGSRGWLFPAMEAYGIAPGEMQPICAELFRRLREFLLSLDSASGNPRSLKKVHVFDSAGLPDIAPATPGAPGISGDWVNEIHLTAGGYRKMGAAFGRFIDEVVDAEYGPL